jgi:hypothetical protein
VRTGRCVGLNGLLYQQSAAWCVKGTRYSFAGPQLGGGGGKLLFRLHRGEDIVPCRPYTETTESSLVDSGGYGVEASHSLPAVVSVVFALSAVSVWSIVLVAMDGSHLGNGTTIRVNEMARQRGDSGGERNR